KSVEHSGGGRIFIRGGEVLLDNGYVFADTVGSEHGQEIEVRAQTLNLENAARITADTFDGSGNSGDIRIRAGKIQLTDGSELSTTSFDSGKAGDIHLLAEEKAVFSGSLLLDGETFDSGVTTSALSSGRGGNVHLETPELQMDDNAGIRADTSGQAHAGDITLETRQLRLENGAQISVSSGFRDKRTVEWGRGDAGTLILRSETIRISGGSPLRHSALLSNTFTAAKGGVIDIETDELHLSEKGRIEAGSQHRGAGGNLEIRARRLSLSGDARISTQTRGDGSGGELLIHAQSMDLSEGAKISAESLSRRETAGNAGEIRIALGNSGLMMRDAEIRAFARNARGGNIRIAGDGTTAGSQPSAGRIQVRNNSVITAHAQGPDENHGGGNVSIHQDEFLILEQSRILANAVGGNGGNIDIVAKGFIRSPDSEVNASSKNRLDGEIRIHGTTEDALQNLSAPRTDWLTMDKLMPPCQARSADSRFFATGREGVPNATDDWLPGGPRATLDTAALPASLRAQAKIGEQAFRQGRFAEAAARWQHIAASRQAHQHQGSNTDILSRLAAAYQGLGMHYTVFKTLDKALLSTEKTGNISRRALLLSQFSDAWLTTGLADIAASQAKTAVELARSAEDRAVLARALNNRGNALSVLARYPEALPAYREAEALAVQTGEQALLARILLNRINALFKQGNGLVTPDELLPELSRIRRILKQLPGGHAKSTGHLALGAFAQALWEKESARREWMQEAQTAYRQAARSAEAARDLRHLSIAHARLGRLYEIDKQHKPALLHTRQAIFHAEQSVPFGAPGRDGRHSRKAGNGDILYRWLWQRARIHQARGEPERALASYRRAAETLQAVQAILSIGSRKPGHGFDNMVRPLYYGLAELLLQQAANAKPMRRQEYLKEARRYLEQVKAVEIRDYYRDECLQKPREAELEQLIPAHTAVVYPLPLENRLVLLVSLRDKNEDSENRTVRIHQAAVPVGRKTIEQQARQFHRDLQTRSHKRFMKSARLLYAWLIEPLEPLLSEHAVDTLVMVPDGWLCMVPPAALHDGKRFLAERYALAVTPGLTLNTPRTVVWKDANMLLAGLSDSVSGYPPLPQVPAEIRGIQEIAHARVLLNEAFSARGLEQALGEKAYTVVHLATHGEFDIDPEFTYLLAHDQKLRVDQLQHFLGKGRSRENPLELLTLSACKTAVGDDRAALGL
ncbi:MAG: CHAT domain-containing protein, partial [Gammaproteobacteria bacterium]|nr:CHAT domain-containing protein [Gammaproteobacteria bacterium]